MAEWRSGFQGFGFDDLLRKRRLCGRSGFLFSSSRQFNAYFSGETNRFLCAYNLTFQVDGLVLLFFIGGVSTVNLAEVKFFQQRNGKGVILTEMRTRTNKFRKDHEKP